MPGQVNRNGLVVRRKVRHEQSPVCVITAKSVHENKRRLTRASVLMMEQCHMAHPYYFWCVSSHGNWQGPELWLRISGGWFHQLSARCDVLDRPVALYGGAEKVARIFAVVGCGVMHGAAIVPEEQVVRVPFVPIDELVAG